MKLTVTARDGRVSGTSENGVLRFLGIPYAEAGRFAAPHPPAGWSGVREATSFGPIAPQHGGAQFLRADHPQDEDGCLTLNVWAPATAGPHPVVVWIHGGAFRTGASASPLYDGAELARRGEVVVVTINYRLGPLGFLAHESLVGDDGAAANWGLLDQLEALRWVAGNAAAFGGDPSNVTVVGESAGATSVLLLVVSPLTAGLASKVVAQSPSTLGNPFDVGAELAELLAHTAGVRSVRDLVDLPVERLLAAQDEMLDPHFVRLLSPVVDRHVVPQPGLDALRSGVAAGIPLIVGSNLDEWKLWAPGDPRSRDLDGDGLRARVGRTAADPDAVIATVAAARVARGESTAPNELWFAIETERVFRGPTLDAADAHVAHQPATFVYLFGWPSPAMDGWLGACHGLEIPFVFGTHGSRVDRTIGACTGSGADADRLSDRMLGAWTAFFRAGNPSTLELAWPAHDVVTRPTMTFAATSRVVAAPREPERAVFATR